MPASCEPAAKHLPSPNQTAGVLPTVGPRLLQVAHRGLAREPGAPKSNAHPLLADV